MHEVLNKVSHKYTYRLFKTNSTFICYENRLLYSLRQFFLNFFNRRQSRFQIIGDYLCQLIIADPNWLVVARERIFCHDLVSTFAEE